MEINSFCFIFAAVVDHSPWIAPIHQKVKEETGDKCANIDKYCRKNAFKLELERPWILYIYLVRTFRSLTLNEIWT